MRREGLRRILLSCPTCCASHRLITIALSNTCLRMRSGRRNILCIRLAVAAKSARGVHALLKCCEATIRAAIIETAVNCAPRIVLGLGACSDADDTDANSQHEQQEPHTRLLGWPLSYKRLLSRFIPYPRAMKRAGSPNGHVPTQAKTGVQYLQIDIRKPR